MNTLYITLPCTGLKSCSHYPASMSENKIKLKFDKNVSLNYPWLYY